MLGADGTHFGAGSVLSAIRNRISFHYSDKENLTEASFRQLPESEPLQFYLSRAAQPYELVVNEVRKDMIIGYISAPKVQQARPKATAAN